MLKWGIGAAAAALATAFVGGSASAQTYLQVTAGWNNLDDADTVIDNGAGTNVPIKAGFQTDEDWSGHVALGFDSGDWRFEAEVGKTQPDVSAYQEGTPNRLKRNAQGSINLNTLFANLYRDFDIGGGITPFVGVGAGFVNAELEFAGPPLLSPNSPTVTLLDDTGTNFSWQGIVGLSVPIASNIKVIGQYRYYDGGTFDMTEPGGHATHVEVKGISWDVGVRWSF